MQDTADAVALRFMMGGVLVATVFVGSMRQDGGWGCLRARMKRPAGPACLGLRNPSYRVTIQPQHRPWKPYAWISETLRV